MAIEFVKKPFKKEENLSCLESYVREWFVKTFKELTPPQKYSFKLISEGHNVVITAPTGSGKTIAGFLSILSELFKMGKEGKLKDSVYCIYVSPLKALDNDIKRNLLIPLKEIREIAKNKGIDLPEVRIAVRSGDVTPHEKQRQLKQPPHILITTPESLAVMLNAPKFSRYLSTVKWVIVDEIHELANNKRGVHLSLSLERLQEIAGKFIRIGLGATLHPIENAAAFLVGYDDSGELRDCKIVDVSWYKPYDLKVLCPVKDIIHSTAEQLNSAMYKLLDKLISEHRTTLIFTNTRSGTERVVFHLKDKWKNKYSDTTIGAHHGSLSREIRLSVEEMLKKGLLKAVVCSTSLELGIDIGYIDLVVQIGSPKSVTRAIQRIGRSGHKFGDIAKGIIIAMDRDDLIECAVMLKCALERHLDKIQIPKNCLDVLAQHIVGMALNKKWNIKDALKVIKRSYCYHDLNEETFKKLLHYLAGHYLDLKDQKVYGKIWYDENDGMFGKRGKYTRIIYYLNIGTIPDEVKVDVYKLPDKKYIGNIEEGFLERLKPGDIFVLGGKLYEFRYAKAMRCYVSQAPKEAVPTIPAWFSELLPLSFDLALEIQKFRKEMKKKFEKGENEEEIISWLLKNYPIDKYSAYSIYEYFKEQYEYCNIIPSFNEILIEETYDLQGRKYIVFHSLYGRRTNDVLSRIVAIIISNQLGKNIGVIVSDNGFALHIPKKSKVDISKLLEEIKNTDPITLLRENIRRTELMNRRFRHCATRSFLILRNYKGHKISVSKQQTNAQTLIKVCEEIDPKFPIIEETYREILEDVFDIENALKVISWIKNGKVEINYIKTNLPSPFAHNLIILGEADVVLMEDRKKALLELHEAIMKSIENRKKS
ncbi:MAG: ATP-dependent helicase [Nitrososphaerota archaeon]